MLDNMSANGFLLWTERTIPVGSRMFISVKPDEEEEAPIEVTATVIRISPEKRGAHFGYGCLIEGASESY